MQQQERESSDNGHDNMHTPGNRTSLEIATAGGGGSGSNPHPITSYGDYEDDPSGGYDARSSEEYEYDHSYHQPQQQQQQHQQQHHHHHQSTPYRTNGVAVSLGGGGGGGGGGGRGGYSVAGSHDYLGYPKDKQPFDSQRLWDDDRRYEELW